MLEFSVHVLKLACEMVKHLGLRPELTKMNACVVQMAFLVLLLAYIVTVCRGQVNVTVSDIYGKKPIFAVELTETPLACQYVIEPEHTVTSVDGLQWKKGSTDAGSDLIGSISSAGVVTYNPPYDEPDYVISSTDVSKGCNLTIKNTSKSDTGTYRCAVFVREPSLVPYYGNAQMEVNAAVAVTSFMIYDEDGKSIKENSTVFLDSNKASYMFNVKVPGIYPGIESFMWTVGVTELPGVRLLDEVDDAGLITSSSNTTLTPKEEYHMEHLRCQAMDREKVVASTGLILEITVPDPCQNNPCQNDGTCTNWNGMPNCTCTGEFTGDTCSKKVPTTPPPEPTQPTGTDGKPTTAGGLGPGEIAGICIGAVAAVAIVTTLILCFLFRESCAKHFPCLADKSAVGPDVKVNSADKEALEMNGGTSASKEKEG